MKKINRVCAILLAICMTCYLSACGKKTEDKKEETDGTITVEFNTANLAAFETAYDGTIATVSYKAGDRKISFLTTNVNIGDDGALIMSSESEILTDSGVEAITGARIVSNAGEEYPVTVNGLFALDEPVDYCYYGCDLETSIPYPDENGSRLTEFGHATEKVCFTYSTLDENDTCTVSSITFYCDDETGETPENLSPIYLKCADESAGTLMHGFAYDVSWDFSDSSIVADYENDGDYITSLSLYNNANGEIEKFVCDKCRLANGVLTIEEGGNMTLITQMGGIGSAAVTLDESVENSGILQEGYDIFGAETAASTDEMVWGNILSLENEYPCNSADFNVMCNFIRLCPKEGAELSITSLSLTYDNVAVELNSASLDKYFYGWYLVGDRYDSTREHYSESDGIYDFELMLTSDSTYEEADEEDCRIVYGVPENLYSIGNLLSGDGSVKDYSEPLEIGDQLEVTIGKYTFNVELPIFDLYQADNLKEVRPQDTASADGAVNVLVVPLCFEDQAATVSENDTTLEKYLGRILNEDGTVTDYSDENTGYSFSEYFDKASYGQCTLNSFVTDWYTLSGSYEEGSSGMLSDSEETITQIRDWVNATYPDMLSNLDQDGDGLYDAVIFIVAPSPEELDSFVIMSYQGAYNISLDHDYMHAVTDGSGAGINHFTSVSMNLNGSEENYVTNTICHEFSHQLGLNDYYDTGYSGINAIGTYDMESSNSGDWNAYSKFAAGWISPTVVTEDDIENGITLTINAFETDGSAIVIPTANTEINEDGTISPFSEYLIIDLFTPEGLYADSAADYGLTNAGVRIYHIDSRLVTITDKDIVGNSYTIGMSRYTNSYNELGYYEIELLQAGGINTFTDLNSDNLRNRICGEDLFYTGDVFNGNDFSSFFYDGVFDDGSAIDFTIKVDSVDNDTATITISR